MYVCMRICIYTRIYKCVIVCVFMFVSNYYVIVIKSGILMVKDELQNILYTYEG